MSVRITIPNRVYLCLQRHLFQDQLEQGAFLFAQADELSNELNIEAISIYEVPSDAWEHQEKDYLQMKDSERAKIMKIAREANLGIIDCHSHPGSRHRVSFSICDREGITDFAAYAQWKLCRKPFAAMVWGESSVDAVVWDGNFECPLIVREVVVTSNGGRKILPTGSWFHNINK